MKRLPVIIKNNERKGIRKRIDLANRPRLNIPLDQLEKVAATLAVNDLDRARFVADPVSYLRDQLVPVRSGKLVRGNPPQTAEACTANAACNVNAVANVNAASKVNVTNAVNVVFVANVIVVTNVKIHVQEEPVAFATSTVGLDSTYTVL